MIESLLTVVFQLLIACTRDSLIIEMILTVVFHLLIHLLISCTSRRRCHFLIMIGLNTLGVGFERLQWPDDVLGIGFGQSVGPDDVGLVRVLTSRLTRWRNGELRLPVFDGSFADVKREILNREDSEAILLIYFHSEISLFSYHDILFDSQVAFELDSPKCIFWMCDVYNHPVYYDLAEELGYRGEFPAFLFLGEFKGKYKPVKALSGSIDSKVLIGALREVKSVFNARRQLEEENTAIRTQTQILREEQDLAYKQSLEADRRKAEQKRLEEETIQKELEERELFEVLEKSKIETIQLVEEPEPSNPDAVVLSIQLVDGTRVNRRFLKSHRIQDVYDLCAVQMKTDVEQLSLKIPFPLQVLSDKSLSLEAAGIRSNTRLIVDLH